MKLRKSILTLLSLVTIACDTASAFNPTNNALANPGFESGLDSWNTAGAGAYWFVDRDFSPENAGVGAVAVSSDSLRDPLITQCIPVSAGKTYLLSAWATAFCSGNAQLSIQWTDTSCTADIGDITSPSSTIVGDWAKLSVAAEVPVGVTRAIVGLDNANSCNDVVFFDDASFTDDTLFKDSFEPLALLL